jgi:hypothetical protein
MTLSLLFALERVSKWIGENTCIYTDLLGYTTGLCRSDCCIYSELKPYKVIFERHESIFLPPGAACDTKIYAFIS